MYIGYSLRDFRTHLIILAAPLLWLWFSLINHLRVEWTLNSQYTFGWAVPFLCLYFGWRRFKEGPQEWASSAFNDFFACNHRAIGLAGLLALLYVPTRLIEETNPNWRLVTIALTAEVLGLTFCLLRVALMATHFRIRDFFFPLMFFWVALPWPSMIEMPIIQMLARLQVLVTTNTAGLLGLQVVPHGNIIELAMGRVRIDEVSLGFKAMHATLIVSIFFGEYFLLRSARRWLLVFTGLTLALFLYAIRLMALVWIGARGGIEGFNRWDNGTCAATVLACLFAVWFMAIQFREKPSPHPHTPQVTSRLTALVPTPMQLLGLFFLAVFWLVMVEMGVCSWYQFHESRLDPPLRWSIKWPTNASIAEVPVSPLARHYMRYDIGEYRKWPAENGTCEAVFLSWNSNRVAAGKAVRQTPKILLSNNNNPMGEPLGPVTNTVKGLDFSFEIYQITNAPQPAFVAYNLWIDRQGSQQAAVDNQKSKSSDSVVVTWKNRLEPIAAGRRSPSQRSIEILMTGKDVGSFEGAKRTLEEVLGEIIVRED